MTTHTNVPLPNRPGTWTVHRFGREREAVAWAKRYGGEVECEALGLWRVVEREKSSEFTPGSAGERQQCEKC